MKKTTLQEIKDGLFISMTPKEKFDHDSQRIRNNCNKFIEGLMKEYIDHPSVKVEFRFYYDTDPEKLEHRTCIYWEGVDKEDGWVQYHSDPIDWYWWQNFVFDAKKDIPKFLGHISSWNAQFMPDENTEFEIKHLAPISEEELEKFNSGE